MAVINLRTMSSDPKYLFVDGVQVEVRNINGYLVEGGDLYVSRRTKPLTKSLPPMSFGNMPLDGGALLLDEHEREALLAEAPQSERFIRRLYGSKELINDIRRFCLWIKREDVAEAVRATGVNARVERTRQFRELSKDKASQSKAATPWSFREQREALASAILVPNHSSERRNYVPVGFVDKNVVATNALNVVYDGEEWVFAVLTSRMHMTWVRAVGGKLKTDYRYSNSIVYNNFPVPPLSEAAKEQLTECALRVLDVREYHSELTLADLYDPDKMPENLRRAHQELDDLVDSIYRKREFSSDEERLSLLFEMYAKMTEAEGKK